MEYILIYLSVGLVLAWAADSHEPRGTLAIIFVTVAWLPATIVMGQKARKERGARDGRSE